MIQFLGENLGEELSWTGIISWHRQQKYKQINWTIIKKLHIKRAQPTEWNEMGENIFKSYMWWRVNIEKMKRTRI